MVIGTTRRTDRVRVNTMIHSGSVVMDDAVMVTVTVTATVTEAVTRATEGMTVVTIGFTFESEAANMRSSSSRHLICQ